MRIEYVALDELARWPRNPKAHDVSALEHSIERFGFVAPLLVDETTGHLIAGHGRLETLQAMKAKHVAPPQRVEVAEDGRWRVPVVRGLTFASAREAEAYLLADNQLTLLGGWNDAELLALLTEHAAIPGGLDGIGFDQAMIQDLGRRVRLADDDDDVSEALHWPLFGRDRVLEACVAHFRRVGFPYRHVTPHEQMLDLNRLAAMSSDSAMTTNLGYAVADTYHPHRFACHAVNMKSPEEAFADDHLLRRSISLMFDSEQRVGAGYWPTLGFVSHTQACSNFRPGVAMTYYRRWGVKGGVVLDPCAGYGGRLVGWLASQLGGTYVGVDPSTLTCVGNRQLAHTLALADARVEIIEQPFEDFDVGLYRGLCDFIFTSPPYFAKELYADEATQSWQRFKTWDEWREGFLEVLMRRAFECARPGAVCVINIADVEIGPRRFPCAQATRDAGVSAGFALEAEESLEFRARANEGTPMMPGRVDAEPVLVFRKPS